MVVRRFWVLVLVALLLVACGSDDKSKSDASDSASDADGTGDTPTGDTPTADTRGDTPPSDTPTDTPSDGPGDTVSDTPNDAQPDMPPAGKRAMFVAMGHVGRTVISCDDGASWVADRDLNTEADAHVCGSTTPTVCFTDGFDCTIRDNDMCVDRMNNCDCDHHPGAGQGIAYGDGYFVGTWGWGPPGSVRRSANGVDWTLMVDNTRFGGIGFGNGTFVTGDRNPLVSADGGATWTDGGMADLVAPNMETVWNVREFGFADGIFVVTGESGDNRDMLVSNDEGASWFRPTTLPTECAAGAAGVTGGNGIAVVVHRDGTVCHSSDDGVNFAVSSTGGEVVSNVVHDGTQFVTYGRGVRYTSADGAMWASTPTVPDNIQIGSMARNPETGTWAAVRGGWQVWYDQQEFYRSADGVTWTALDPSAFPGSHPIRAMTFGYGDPSAVCP